MPGDKFKYENSLEDEMVRSYPRQLQLGLEPGERTRGWGEGDESFAIIPYNPSSLPSPTPYYSSPTLEDAVIVARWEEDYSYGETGEKEYVWTNKKDPKLTVNVHTFWSEQEDEEGKVLDDVPQWYVYPAYNGRGIPNSPNIVESEEEALREA